MKRSLLGALALALAFAVVGCGGGGGGTSVDTRGPAVSNVSVTPASLTFNGGQINISATVSDTTGVQSVVAVIAKSGSTPVEVPMTASGTTYTASYSIPANTSTTGQTNVYSVTVRATDTLNYSSTMAAGSVQVAAPDEETVPPPPVFPS